MAPAHGGTRQRPVRIQDRHIGRKGGGEWINDPLNPHEATDPFGANSVCMTNGYEVPEWTPPDAAAPSGAIEEIAIESNALGGRRAVGVYLPAGYDPAHRYPLVVVHDGIDYVEHAALNTVLDNST